MTARAVDLEKLRVALRRLSRGELLMVCDRAIELVPRARLAALVGDVLRLDELTKTNAGAVPLLAEIRKFHEASMRGDYYESFAVSSKNFMDMSEGTEAFMAEFDRLVGKCIRAVDAQEPRAPLRESFELLFGLLRYIDECNDDGAGHARHAGARARSGRARCRRLRRLCRAGRPRGPATRRTAAPDRARHMNMGCSGTLLGMAPLLEVTRSPHRHQWCSSSFQLLGANHVEQCG